MTERSDSNSQNRYISSLEMRNFQLHKDTKMNFSPGLNVITGGNHRGKSTIMRAIQYLVTCRPIQEVDGLTRFGTKSFFIRLTMSDGSWVIREKGKDINQYIVYDVQKGGDPIKLSGFGTTPPAEVKDVLGMGLVSFGAKKNVFLNMSQQDEIFLIGEGDAEMARWMYSITNLHEIRGAMEQMIKECKTMADSTKDSDARIEDLQKKLDDMPDLEMLEMIVKADEEQRKALSDHVSKIKDMETLQRGMLDLRDKAIPIKKRINERKPVLEEISKDLPSSENSMKILWEMIQIGEKIETLEKDISSLRARDRVIIQKKRIDVSESIEMLSRIGALIEMQETIEKTNSFIETAKIKIARSEKNKANIKDAISELEREMFGDDMTCPLCGQTVGEDLADHIVSEGDEE